MPLQTKAQLLTLKTEIALPAYAGMDEPAVADALNAKSIASDVDVDIETINRYLIGNGIDGKINARIEYYRAKIAAAAAPDSADEQKLAALMNARSAFTRLPSFNTSVTATKNFVFTMIDTLVTEGVVTTTPAVPNQRAQLRQMVAGNISRAEELFGRGTRVDSGDVSRAKVAT